MPINWKSVKVKLKNMNWERGKVTNRLEWKYNKNRNQNKIPIFSGCWIPQRLSPVPDPVSDIHGRQAHRHLQAQPRWGEYLVWGPQTCIPALCRWCGSVYWSLWALLSLRLMMLIVALINLESVNKKHWKKKLQLCQHRTSSTTCVWVSPF